MVFYYPPATCKRALPGNFCNFLIYFPALLQTNYEWRSRPTTSSSPAKRKCCCDHSGMQNAKALIIYVSLHLHIRCRWRLRRLDIEEKTITTRSILEGSAKGSERHIQGEFFESQFVYRRPASAVAGYLSAFVTCVYF